MNESFPRPVIRIHRGDKVYVNVQNEGDYGVTKKEETVRHGVKQTRNPWSEGPCLFLTYFILFFVFCYFMRIILKNNYIIKND